MYVAVWVAHATRHRGEHIEIAPGCIWDEEPEDPFAAQGAREDELAGDEDFDYDPWSSDHDTRADAPRIEEPIGEDHGSQLDAEDSQEDPEAEDEVSSREPAADEPARRPHYPPSLDETTTTGWSFESSWLHDLRRAAKLDAFMWGNRFGEGHNFFDRTWYEPLMWILCNGAWTIPLPAAESAAVRRATSMRLVELSIAALLVTDGHWGPACLSICVLEGLMSGALKRIYAAFPELRKFIKTITRCEAAVPAGHGTGLGLNRRLEKLPELETCRWTLRDAIAHVIVRAKQGALREALREARAKWKPLLRKTPAEIAIQMQTKIQALRDKAQPLQLVHAAAKGRDVGSKLRSNAVHSGSSSSRQQCAPSPSTAAGDRGGESEVRAEIERLYQAALGKSTQRKRKRGGEPELADEVETADTVTHSVLSARASRGASSSGVQSVVQSGGESGRCSARDRVGPCAVGQGCRNRLRPDGSIIWHLVPSPSPWATIPDEAVVCNGHYNRALRLRRVIAGAAAARDALSDMRMQQPMEADECDIARAPIRLILGQRGDRNAPT